MTKWTYDAGSTIDLTIKTSTGETYLIYLDPTGEILAQGDVQAQGNTIVIPEFPSVVTLPALIAITLFAVFLAKRKISNKK